jgi:hypothetical protein
MDMENFHAWILGAIAVTIAVVVVCAVFCG